MVSLVMVMFDELVDELAQMSLAKRNHAIETLLFDRADEPLGIGVEIGTLRWQPNRLDTATCASRIPNFLAASRIEATWRGA